MRGRQIYGQQVSEKDKHISSVCACQISSRKWVFLSLTGPLRFLSVFPGYFHLTDAPISWMNYCVLIWGCLLPVREKSTLESRKNRTIVSDGNHGRWLFVSQLNALARAKQRGKMGLLTRVEVLQFADLFLNSEEKEVLQNIVQLLLGVQAETLQVAIPQSEQRTAWRTHVHGQEACLIVTPQSSSAFHRGRCMPCTWYGVFNKRFLERARVAGMLILNPLQHILQRPPGHPLWQVHYPERHCSDTLERKKKKKEQLCFYLFAPNSALITDREKMAVMR